MPNLKLSAKKEEVYAISGCKPRLGVNIDHVATIRNARGGTHPNPVDAAILAQKFGADGITIHLREDRRHIRDEDLLRLKEKISLPINLEMAATEEMLKIALQAKPNAVCLVPEKRQELTTEGGLNILSAKTHLQPIISKLKDQGILVSLFIDPDENQLKCAKELKADIIELHTGEFCRAADIGDESRRKKELARLFLAASLSENLGLECHGGHGLNYETAKIVAKIPQIRELNIGHFIIAEAIFEGLEAVIRKMKAAISAS
jgi:pyridoxine 5-phosphate synthase